MDNVLSKLSYGFYIASTKWNGIINGCVVNTVIQISAEPAVIAVSINSQNYTNELIKKSKKIAISIMTRDIDRKITGNFGFRTGRDINKFENIEYELTPNGIPYLLKACAGYIEADIIKINNVYTHDVFFAKVTDMKYIENNEEILTYDYYKKVKKGTVHKNAPTYKAIEK